MYAGAKLTRVHRSDTDGSRDGASIYGLMSVTSALLAACYFFILFIIATTLLDRHFSKQTTINNVVSVCPELQTKGVTMLMGNDISVGLVVPKSEILDNPVIITTPDSSSGLYPACVATCAQLHKDHAL